MWSGGFASAQKDVVLDDWLERLAAALAAEATRSTETRIALEEALQ